MRTIKLQIDHDVYNSKNNSYNTCLNKQWSGHLRNIVEENKNNPKGMFKSFGNALHRKI